MLSCPTPLWSPCMNDRFEGPSIVDIINAAIGPYIKTHESMYS